jgi:hypothetical protein
LLDQILGVEYMGFLKQHGNQGRGTSQSVHSLFAQEQEPQSRSKGGAAYMPHPDAPDLCRKVDAALDFIPDEAGEEEMRPYMKWQLNNIMDRISPDDLTTAELMALLAVLAPALSRRLGGSTPVRGKLLTLIRDESTGT